MSWELYIPPVVKQKRTSVRITKEQRQFIIDHINDRPRRKIIEQAQVSPATFYQIVKENRRHLDEIGRNATTENAEKVGKGS